MSADRSELPSEDAFIELAVFGAPLTGAFSGLAMALNALATAVAVPLILTTLPWLVRV